VLTIENSRSGDEMIRALADFGYSRDLGPGVYDVHRCGLMQSLVLMVYQICWVDAAHKQHGCGSVSSISGSYAGQEHPASDAQTHSFSTLNLDGFSSSLHLLVP
jgi:Cobalamin-independent synthase, Catalytic domain